MGEKRYSFPQKACKTGKNPPKRDKFMRFLEEDYETNDTSDAELKFGDEIFSYT